MSMCINTHTRAHTHTVKKRNRNFKVSRNTTVLKENKENGTVQSKQKCKFVLKLEGRERDIREIYIRFIKLTVFIYQYYFLNSSSCVIVI